MGILLERDGLILSVVFSDLSGDMQRAIAKLLDEEEQRLRADMQRASATLIDDLVHMLRSPHATRPYIEDQDPGDEQPAPRYFRCRRAR